MCGSYMVYTNDRLSIGESLYTGMVGNQITILSGQVYEPGKLSLFSSFRISTWCTIFAIFIICAAIMIHNACFKYRNDLAKTSLLEITVCVILDHLLMLIGKCKYCITV